MKRARAIYRTLLYGYPAPFRHEYGRQMCHMFEEQLSEARRQGAWPHEVVLWARAAWDLVTIAPREHWHLIRQDVQHAIRTMVAKPAFTMVAVLSLTLGIGANIAIFSLWNAVLYAPLPGVDSPEDLVMMTAPGASGMVRGRSLGPRRWLTYPEFEELRNHAQGFSDLMASQSSLNAWDVRVDGGSLEEMRGRLVSSSFFDVLGTGSAMGRLFLTTEDAGEHAVISHALWQRRFGGRADVIGTTLTIRDTPLTIIGVTPAGFVGETNGQQPDLWLPLRLQPRVLPGGDWLHEKPPDKVMWLHVFGRLRPGVTSEQAEAQANAVFRTNLESFYGARKE